MSDWKSLLTKTGFEAEKIKLEAAKDFKSYGVYADSIHECYGSVLFIVKESAAKKLIVAGDSAVFHFFIGEEITHEGKKIKVCLQSKENLAVIRSLFTFVNPKSSVGRPITIGLGDRLGIASEGHIRLFKNTDAFPILAQQSMRELTLTGRTYPGVLADVCWAVFQEGYEKGFGADGDHLKKLEEVQNALSCGFTMITLDCSEHIRNDVDSLNSGEVAAEYAKLSQKVRSHYESKFDGKTFKVGGIAITFTDDSLKRIVLVYGGAVNHAKNVYHTVIKQNPLHVDFEVSIDETLSCTSPAAHFFMAQELVDDGVIITSMAPRFYGEFQKGIDYIGDVTGFTADFDAHCKIARHFGYKISVHSGSDKFTVFPLVGKLTERTYHLKTAGTNWLEAVRVIAKVNPALYRKMHAFALSALDEAKKYYHIKGKPENIPALDTLKDADLPSLMDKDDSRQIMHITYGLILQAKTKDGKYQFRDDFFTTLYKHDAEYNEALYKHIGKHLKMLGVMK